MKVALQRLWWKFAYRIIPSRYPTIHVYERVADSQDFETLFEIEALTNDRLRHASGKITYFDEAKLPAQENRTYLLAPFTHLNPSGSRFSDGTWGVYYAAKGLPTAVAETCYHRENFMRATNEKPMNLEMRVLTSQVKGILHNFCKKGSVPQSVLDPKSYASSQKIAKALKAKQSNGIVYPSVRDLKHGECVAVFNPELLSHCRVEKHLMYHWDGKKISHVLEFKGLDPRVQRER